MRFSDNIVAYSKEGWLTSQCGVTNSLRELGAINFYSKIFVHLKRFAHLDY